MMTYSSVYEEGKNILKDAGIKEYSLDARILLEEAFSIDYNTLLVHGDTKAPDEKIAKYKEYILARKEHNPVAYIISKQEFMGLEFYVNSNVLIPNQDTEILVEEALKDIHDGMTFMDLCTGSACIGLSVLNYTNDTTCYATDLSKDALEVANINADKLGLSDRIKFFNTDIFPLEKDIDTKFDVILSNPPYIPTKVIDTLMVEVGKKEPFMALDGKEDGLFFYRKICQISPKYLYKGGYLMVEIGYDQAEAVSGLFDENGFKNIEIVKDFGGNDRVVKGYYA